VERREPVEGSALNGPELPSLFIYLLNMLAKAIISQFINECSAKPEAADPIGVVTAQIFSQKDLQWRGKSMIDILMAKFRVACPVLFGFRGNDRTQAGRLAVGWRAGVDERTHNNRMVGLGAGYASIALRDFSKASKANPFPPSNYWKAMAYIVNTPPQQMSDTQFTVLKAMIDGHEQRFISFYGNAAIAALKIAIVDFPKKASAKTPPVAALGVLGDLMKRDRGLTLH
jgi:nucleoporin GLE1